MFFTDPLIAFFKLNDLEVINDSKIYLKVVGGGILFSLLSKLLTTLITATGNSKIPFLATTVGLVFNMLLDPVFIFGLLGVPKMGVLGAAIATVLAQLIVFILLVCYISKDKFLFCYINLKKLPALKYFTSILKLGFPTMIQATLFPLISMYISRLVAGFGDNAVAVQRIGSQIESISWMTTDGFSVAVNSFIAQNYGAKNLIRTKEGFYKALGMLTVLGTFATLLLIFLAKPLFSIFLTEPTVVEMGVSYLVIIGYSQLFLCYEILSSSGLNAFGKTVAPAVVSIFFTAMRIPLALLLSKTALGLDGIWYSVTVTTVFKGSILLILILLFLRKLTKITSET